MPILDDFNQRLAWPERPTDEALRGLPRRPAVCLLLDGHEAPVQLAMTQDLRRFAESRLLAGAVRSPAGDDARADLAAGGDPSVPAHLENAGAASPENQGSTITGGGARTTGPRTDLGEIVREIRWREVHSPFEGRWRHYRAARCLYPRDYLNQIAFGPAWFLWLDPAAGIPEIRVTERIWTRPGEYVGPWPDRSSCQHALEGLWDLFDLCRYPEQVRKAPHGQRCVYADMGRCDAPCDGSVPLSSYQERTRKAWRFARGGIAEWTAVARERMRAEAGAQRFEKAAMLRGQIAFADQWASEWSDFLRTEEQWRLLMAIRSTRRKQWKLFRFDRGELEEGPLIPQSRLKSEAASWIARPGLDSPESVFGAGSDVSDQRVDGSPSVLDGVERMEQTWLVSHLMHHADARAAVIEGYDTRDVSERVASRAERIFRDASP